MGKSWLRFVIDNCFARNFRTDARLANKRGEFRVDIRVMDIDQIEGLDLSWNKCLLVAHGATKRCFDEFPVSFNSHSRKQLLPGGGRELITAVRIKRFE
jgi:hypothetical protein